MFTWSEIAEATGGRPIGPETAPVTGVSTDSRTIKPGELFVPLRGAHFDGHDFLAAAADRGVTAAVVAEKV